MLIEHMRMVHRFWNDKPVHVAPMKVDNTCSIVQTDHGFEKPMVSSSLEWSELAVEDEVSELTIFIQEHYMQSGFPFQIMYSADHLTHELSSKPSKVILLRKRLQDTGSGTRNGAVKGAIIACIMGSVHHYEINLGGNTPKIELCDTLLINFLCVHKSFRHLRLAPALITEISRRVNEDWGIQKAYYISNAELPNPFCKASYHHRILNSEKCELSTYHKASDVEKEKWSTIIPESKRKYKVKWFSGSDAREHIDSHVECQIVNLVNSYHMTHSSCMNHLR